MAKEKAVKNLGGAPTKYEESHCDIVVNLMREGASKAEVCLELNCCFQTFLNWQTQHPEFLESVKKGLHFSKGKWEQIGRKAAFGQVENFNAVSWIFNMKNRFGKMDVDELAWRDKQEVEHSGEVVTFNMDFSNSNQNKNTK